MSVFTSLLSLLSIVRRKHCRKLRSNGELVVVYFFYVGNVVVKASLSSSTVVHVVHVFRAVGRSQQSQGIVPDIDCLQLAMKNTLVEIDPQITV